MPDQRIVTLSPTGTKADKDSGLSFQGRVQLMAFCVFEVHASTLVCSSCQ
jgi:hypothetical protein